MWLGRFEFLSLRRIALAIRFAQASSISTIRAPSAPYLAEMRARPLAARRPDQRQSVKAVAETRHRFAACGLDRLPLPRQGLAKRSWLTMSEAFHSRPDNQHRCGKSLPPRARNAESKGSVSRRAAGCWQDVSFSPQAAPTIQIRDSTRRRSRLRCPAGPSRGPPAKARPVELEGQG